MKKTIIVALLISIFVIAFMAIVVTPKRSIFDIQEVYPGVDVKIQIEKVETKELMGEAYGFVYFKYTIQNQHPNKLFFQPGKIRVKYNGLKNQSVEYNSLASAMTEAEELSVGTNEYALYFVFDQPNVSRSISRFEILDTGLGYEK